MDLFFHSPLTTPDCIQWTSKDFEHTRISSRWSETGIESARLANVPAANHIRPILPTTATLGPFPSTNPSQTDFQEQYTALAVYWETTEHPHPILHWERRRALVHLLVPCTASPAGKSRMAHKTQQQFRNTQSSRPVRMARSHQTLLSEQQAMLLPCLGHHFKAKEVVVQASLCPSLAACPLPTPWLPLLVR